MLKHVLDSCLKEYIHKAVGIVGVSAGPFGGTRMIQNLLPVMRELGLVTIFWDVNFSSVQKVFDKEGMLLDNAFIGRIDKFLKELIWMARTMRGPGNIPRSTAMRTPTGVPPASRMVVKPASSVFRHDSTVVRMSRLGGVVRRSPRLRPLPSPPR